MESPLTQQPRPEAFQQKVVRLYETLFQVCFDMFLSLRRRVARPSVLPQSSGELLTDPSLCRLA